MEKKYLDVPFEIKAEDINEDGVFRGWGSLFNKTPDAYGDVVARGAFTESLAKGGRNLTGIPMLHQHRSDQLPGVWTSLTEKPKGLDAHGKLALKTSLGNDVYEIMKLGAETGTFRFGLSIGYDVIEYEMDKKRKVRTLKKVDLWELSIVTFPAKLGANVTNVKELIQQATTERELEKALRDSDSFSKADAQHIISLCKSVLRDSRSVSDEGLSLILKSLKEVNVDIEHKERSEMSDILNSLQKINT